MLNFNLKHEVFIKEKLSTEIKSQKVSNVFNNLNEYIDLEILNNYIEEKIRNNVYKSSKAKTSAMDSIRGKICEEILAFGIQKFLEENNLDNQIFIDSKTDLIKKYFSIYTAQNVNLRKKIDVDILLYNADKTKLYALSVKGTTRERVGQSETALFLLDKEVMKIKYNASSELFKCGLWSDTDKIIKIRYGIVVYDFGDSKDYTKKTSNGKLRTNSTREFDVELFFQDKKIGGGFTLLNNYENFDNTIRFSDLAGKIQSFFN